MSNFGKFAELIKHQFNKMAEGELYVVDIPRDKLWDLYMEAFPAGTNEIFRERREYDCQTCRQFIKNIAGVVTIKDNKLVSIWDIEAEGYYNDVANFMANKVKVSTIKTKFMHNEAVFGKTSNIQVLDDGSTLTFNHFNCEVPRSLVNRDYRTVLSGVESTKQVFQRGLEEITLDSLETVKELIAQNSLYRGDEFKSGILGFLDMKNKYLSLAVQEKDIFVWSNINSQGARIRNTAIGTLLQDLSEGIDLESAVKAFETKVAPSNYKRPTALVTKGMIDKALLTIDELGIEASLYRRHAKLEDVSVTDVLYTDRTVAKVMKNSVADLLKAEVKVTEKSLGKVEEIGIDDFIKNVLPTVTSLEVLLENKHSSNLCNLISPVDEDAKSILKWDSNFSWSYNGNITDSMKQNVKNAGGNVEGVLRFSIQWNDDVPNQNDLDAHCIQPFSEIYYGNKNGGLSGTLDVDIINPGSKVAVENIIYTDTNKMIEGTYKFYVRNFSGTSGRNFTAEIEFNGEIHSYSYEGLTKGDMHVAEVTYSKAKGFSIKHIMKPSSASKEIYGLKTQQFHKVQLVTLSPNFWGTNEIGNKHFMFILENCKNPEPVRGFYNEFLSNELNEHRKVFEMLASKMECQYSDEQLAGLGFSSTQRNAVTVKVQGTFTRTLKIKF